MSISTPPPATATMTGAILDATPATAIGDTSIAIRSVPLGHDASGPNFALGNITLPATISVGGYAGAIPVMLATSVVSITEFSPDTGTGSDGVTASAMVALRGTISAPAQIGDTIEIYNGETLVGTTVAILGPWSCYVTLAEGVNDLTARVVGFPGSSAVFAVTRDSTPPVLVITEIVPETAWTGRVSGTVGVADAGRTISLYDGSVRIATTTADANGNWSFAGVLLSTAAESPIVRAFDAAENGASVQYVFSSSADRQLYKGDLQRVYGTALRTTLNSLGEQHVHVGGLAQDTQILAGGIQIDWGTATRTTINGGKQFVWGLADDTAVLAGVQHVGSGGIALGATIRGNGEQLVHSGGTASGTAIVLGSQSVHGAASDVFIYATGIQYVYGTAAGTTIISGGKQIIHEGGTATGTTLNVGTTQIDWGTAIDTLITGGAQFVWGIATGTTVVTGAQYVGAGGTANGTTVGNGGLQSVYGSATSTTIDNGGEQNVYADGTAAGATVNFGGVQIDWGAAVGTTINGGIQYVWGTATGTTIAWGVQHVGSGGFASDTMIDSGGIQYIHTGGAAHDVTFDGPNATLALDQAAAFSGTISGWEDGDRIDLGDILFDGNTTLAYSANPRNTGGMLTVSDGVHVAALELLGQYTAADFALSSDGHGGTLVIDPGPANQSQSLLSPALAA
jgi:autotransporter passenger strand-loop-strand repeat protein